MANGALEVTVIECRNLKDKDKHTKCDSFVELYLDKDYKQRTNTIKSSNTPVWHETFRFYKLKSEDHLYLKVYNETLIGKASLGTAKIAFEKIREAGGYLDEWFQLSTHFGLPADGEIRLILRFT